MELQNNVLIPTDKTDEFVINLGPQHPSTHGVLHLTIKLDGEQILDIEPHLGYIHRGIEKMSESLGYKQSIFLTSRMDYLSAHINNQACSLAIEKAIKLELKHKGRHGFSLK